MSTNEFEFEVEVTETDAKRFADLSGDWNPLHTDLIYSAKTNYRRSILHGAYSAGLISRMAGMHIPGRDCLLHGIRLKFISPIYLPAKLKVRAKLIREIDGEGGVEVFITNSDTGIQYVNGSYEFGRHVSSKIKLTRPLKSNNKGSLTLVTGASGELASKVLKRLGSRALGITKSKAFGALVVEDFADIKEVLAGRKVNNIIHCGWPSMDNQGLIELGIDIDTSIQFNLAKPLGECVKLAQVLASHGAPNASLLLVGSTAADPGRHNWRMPLYSLAKSLIPTLVKILAVELGSKKMRCIGVIFDVIQGGMNANMRDVVKLAHADRSPTGSLPSPEEAADQILWALENSSFLISGAVINFSGGALP